MSIFPLAARPAQDYHLHPRSFGSLRDGGLRKHAGCDLYAPHGTDVLAVADGCVVRGPYLFYDGVDALEIEHPGIGIVRYGEIQAAGCPVKARDQVKAGQVIAHVGKMAHVSQSMLHFELYAGTDDRPLTVRANLPYARREDLSNPTGFLDGCQLKGASA
jgi:murein DD-endopeptidase MepM/ murein hydrolase activator NlpD